MNHIRIPIKQQGFNGKYPRVSSVPLLELEARCFGGTHWTTSTIGSWPSTWSGSWRIGVGKLTGSWWFFVDVFLMWVDWIKNWSLWTMVPFPNKASWTWRYMTCWLSDIPVLLRTGLRQVIAMVSPGCWWSCTDHFHCCRDESSNAKCLEILLEVKVQMSYQSYLLQVLLLIILGHSAFYHFGCLLWMIVSTPTFVLKLLPAHWWSGSRRSIRKAFFDRTYIIAYLIFYLDSPL